MKHKQDAAAAAHAVENLELKRVESEGRHTGMSSVSALAGVLEQDLKNWSRDPHVREHKCELLANLRALEAYREAVLREVLRRGGCEPHSGKCYHTVCDLSAAEKSAFQRGLETLQLNLTSESEEILDALMQHCELPQAIEEMFEGIGISRPIEALVARYLITEIFEETIEQSNGRFGELLKSELERQAKLREDSDKRRREAFEEVERLQELMEAALQQEPVEVCAAPAPARHSGVLVIDTDELWNELVEILDREESAEQVEERREEREGEAYQLSTEEEELQTIERFFHEHPEIAKLATAVGLTQRDWTGKVPAEFLQALVAAFYCELKRADNTL